jgi:anti-sigma factor RsiW
MESGKRRGEGRIRSTVNCQDCRDFVDAYVDNELDAASAIRHQQHLHECRACRDALGSRQTLQTLLRRQEMRFEPPPELRGSVTRLLAREAAAGEAAARKTRVIPLFIPWAIAAALVFFAGLTWFNPGAPFRAAAQAPIVAEIISSHIRSLLADHLLDVTSSDQHTVKPWFAGKIEYSPPVKELAAQGFRLAGGRLDYVNNRVVGVLVYVYNKHVINLFVWPAGGEPLSGESVFTQTGYSLVHWVDNGMTFWAVSDAGKDVLRKFCDTIKG